MRKLVYYVASTIDGYICAPDGSWDFFTIEPDLSEYITPRYPEFLPTAGRKMLGVTAPNARFDTVVMGRGTYDPALKEGITSPYAHLKQYVFSRSVAAPPEPEVEVVSGDPVEFVRRLKQQEGGDIWLCGGGDLAGQLLDEIDELLIKLNPVIVGSGVPLVTREFDPRRFVLFDSRAFDSGIVLLNYRKP
ncbi:dihydrofolate reductase family protein [Micromonospora sonneratiae]|uniref:Dihydrofolate reductase family protein n=1 Tax=Micromonospora sonneratiae TaxID=1184706 RepID=A0ABW3YGR9_9ACTN